MRYDFLNERAMYICDFDSHLSAQVDGYLFCQSMHMIHYMQALITETSIASDVFCSRTTGTYNHRPDPNALRLWVDPTKPNFLVSGPDSIYSGEI